MGKKDLVGAVAAVVAFPLPEQDDVVRFLRNLRLIKLVGSFGDSWLPLLAGSQTGSRLFKVILRGKLEEQAWKKPEPVVVVPRLSHLNFNGRCHSHLALA